MIDYINCFVNHSLHTWYKSQLVVVYNSFLYIVVFDLLLLY